MQDNNNQYGGKNESVRESVSQQLEIIQVNPLQKLTPPDIKWGPQWNGGADGYKK